VAVHKHMYKEKWQMIVFMKFKMPILASLNY
jgi:hypothetical protein